MPSILNAIRSATPSPARQFTSLNIASSTSIKSAFHPEHHPIILQQLVESISPRAQNVASDSVVRDALSKTTSTAK
ncbi:hypothetical protein BGZ54_002088, partial [Gamsiella multidivaricata]